MFESAAEEFRALYAEWVGAVKAHDRAWFGRVFADDFTFQAFLRDDAGGRHTVVLDKAEFTAFELHMVDIEFEALAVEATVQQDLAVSWLLAQERATLAEEADDFTRGVLAKMQIGGDTERVASSGARALTSASWRRSGDGWECFSQQVVGVLA